VDRSEKAVSEQLDYYASQIMQSPLDGWIFRLSHAQTLDIEPTCTKQPGNAPEHTKLVLYKHSKRVPAHGIIVGRHIRITQTRRLIQAALCQ
jgi:hypothetical protein